MSRVHVRHAGSVLVLEDDYFIASDLSTVLRDQGINVVGPSSTIQEAQDALAYQSIDGAILDIKIGDAVSFDFAESLLHRGVPVLFSTGYDAANIPDQLQSVQRFQKPLHPDRVREWVRSYFAPFVEENLAPPQAFRNTILKSFSKDELAIIRPHMSSVKLRSRSVLVARHRPIPRVYFPESVVGSVIAGVGDKIMEAGLIGSEGVIGASSIVDSGPAMTQVLVQAEGEAIAVSAAILRDLVGHSTRLALLFLRYQHGLAAQLVETALSHAAFTVEQRLARWLLLSQDRVGSRVAVVQEFLALMLHVRRPSVTLAMQMLEKEGCVLTERGQIIILDRDKPIAATGGCYGQAEAMFKRLMA